MRRRHGHHPLFSSTSDLFNNLPEDCAEEQALVNDTPLADDEQSDEKSEDEELNLPLAQLASAMRPGPNTEETLEEAYAAANRAAF